MLEELIELHKQVDYFESKLPEINNKKTFIYWVIEGVYNIFDSFFITFV